jgi:hypothetical protein
VSGTRVGHARWLVAAIRWPRHHKLADLVLCHTVEAPRRARRRRLVTATHLLPPCTCAHLLFLTANCRSPAAS